MTDTQTPPGPEHGRYTTYSNWKCRCDLCRAAWAEYSRGAAARRAAQLQTTQK